MSRQLLATVTFGFFVSLISAYSQSSDFMSLVRSGTPQSIQAAIDKGSDMSIRDETYGATVLMNAAANNPNPDVIAVLIKAGADINARDHTTGATALMWAALWNPNAAMITALLKAGADINAQDTTSAQTALIVAAFMNPNPDVVMTLLLAGADAKIKDNNGRTAFDYASDSTSLKGTEAFQKLEEASK